MTRGELCYLSRWMKELCVVVAGTYHGIHVALLFFASGGSGAGVLPNSEYDTPR